MTDTAHRIARKLGSHAPFATILAEAVRHGGQGQPDDSFIFPYDSSILRLSGPREHTALMPESAPQAIMFKAVHETGNYRYDHLPLADVSNDKEQQ